MPGPSSRKKKKKGKQSKQAKETTTVRLPEIEDVEGWNDIISAITVFFELPDFTKRSGIKQAHVEFDTIVSKLILAYQACGDFWKLKGGIVGIIAKISADTILRNKLVHKGILHLVLPLFDVDETRHIALQSLVCIARNGDQIVCLEITRIAEKIIKLLNDFPADDKVTEFCVMVLALTFPTWVYTGGPTQPRYPLIGSMLEAVMEAIRRPHQPSRYLVEHAVDLIRKITENAWKDVRAHPPAIEFLTAGLSSKDWIVRSKCLGGLLRLYDPGSEHEGTYFEMMHILSASDRLTPKLNQALEDYGIDRTEIYFGLTCTLDSNHAIAKFEEDRNLYALGLKFAWLIMHNDSSIVLTGGEPEISPDGLPDARSLNILPLAAAAIRMRGNPAELDFADALDIKYYFQKEQPQAIVDLVEKGLQRNPKQSYYYYAMVRLRKEDHVDALRFAKKGLKCEQLPPFIRRRLLHMAVHLAGNTGFLMLQELTDSDAGKEKWEKGIAFFMSAYEDARVLLDEAPPDSKYLKDAGYWFVLLSIVIREDLSPDLRELSPALKRTQLAREFYQAIFATPPMTIIRMTQEEIVKHYPSAIQNFGPLFTALDTAKGVPKADVKHGVTADDVEAWFERMNMEDMKDPVFTPKSTLRTVDFEHVTLYRCSWCGNPSAALKKCSRCTKTLYCDGDCQKSHWTVHKKVCNRQ
ncbi:hypothetical protein CPB83DRAFT_788319 [Crepidotus variabilis]|uniref:MYND-type domain-containing protein n=1 Tax=Crepidotus variabilis TaxID=179855 RepID=A0A9P6EKL7_9AGAR|nr:hypothetical protein CPB83DRAFT_788319 [Crepidotus variabilis]